VFRGLHAMGRSSYALYGIKKKKDECTTIEDEGGNDTDPDDEDDCTGCESPRPHCQKSICRAVRVTRYNRAKIHRNKDKTLSFKRDIVVAANGLKIHLMPKVRRSGKLKNNGSNITYEQIQKLYKSDDLQLKSLLLPLGRLSNVSKKFQIENEDGTPNIPALELQDIVHFSYFGHQGVADIDPGCRMTWQWNGIGGRRGRIVPAIGR